jgi:branched-chain amino acid transport system ATP-binding protein
VTVASDHTAPALVVAGLDAGYGRSQILRGVSLTVPASGIVALLGPNGAGKTTLLRAITGFVPVTAGSIQVFGEKVDHKVPPHRRFGMGICHIPEGRGVWRSLTVRENLVMQVGSRGLDEAIERAGSVFPILATRLEQKAGALSGGQQQMLAMVAAYVRHPRLILVDEASLGLAPLVVDEIFDFLARVAATGTALLVVDQFAAKVLDLVKTAYVLKQGEIVFAGSAGQLADEDLFSRYLGSQEGRRAT